MKKRFVVAINSNDNKQNMGFQSYIKENGCGWWHWIDGFWLITDPKGQLTATKLRTDLQRFYPSVRQIVFEFEANDGTWSGFGPNSENKNMFTWMEKNW